MTPGVLPLSDLLAVGRPADDVVAVHAGRLRPWSELTARVGGLARALEATPTPARWALFTDDAWAFAVGLLAIWQARGIAVIPPNGQPGTLKDLSADVRGIVTDRPDDVVGRDVIPVLGPGAEPPARWRRVDSDTPALELYTSGTSGAPHVAVKAVGHLDREVAAHDARWGGLVADAHAVATVSHQHIYGLLFRVAWPLAAGRVFRGEAFLHPAEVAAAMAQAPSAYLVATPAHLRRLKESPGSLARLAPSCRVIFSSGGPLDAETAQALARALGAAPIEIFGSTETGGVAWRRQEGDTPAAWTPFEPVTVRVVDEDSRLRVRSPWLDAPDGELTMGDRAEIMPDGRFLLGARVDRIVKIHEKRLALPEMEGRLREHPFVAAVALVVLDHRGEARLAAVIVPSEEGTAMLRREQRRGFARTLRRWLAPHWDRVLLPRLWRFVDHLPEDAQGKTSAASLQALFGPGAAQ